MGSSREFVLLELPAWVQQPAEDHVGGTSKGGLTSFTTKGKAAECAKACSANGCRARPMERCVDCLVVSPNLSLTETYGAVTAYNALLMHCQVTGMGRIRHRRQAINNDVFGYPSRPETSSFLAPQQTSEGGTGSRSGSAVSRSIIIGATIAGVGVLLSIVVAIVLLLRSRRRRNAATYPAPSQAVPAMSERSTAPPPWLAAGAYQAVPQSHPASYRPPPALAVPDAIITITPPTVVDSESHEASDELAALTTGFSPSPPTAEGAVAPGWFSSRAELSTPFDERRRAAPPPPPRAGKKGTAGLEAPESFLRRGEGSDNE